MSESKPKRTSRRAKSDTKKTDETEENVAPVEITENADPVEAPKTRSTTSFPTNEEQVAEHERREKERQAQRDEHNERVAPGGGRL